MINLRFVAAVLCSLCSLGATVAAAMSGPTRQEYRSEMVPVVFQAGGMSLEQAVAMVQSKYGARVMRANTVEEDGKAVHYIRLMTPDRSRVWTVRVDAASGREI
jgi:hypothetical protein